MNDLTAALRRYLAPLPAEQRYAAGLRYLDGLHAEQGGKPLDYLRVLIAAGGDQLDQTVFLPTGLQRISLN